jgi:hypothetical protein
MIQRSILKFISRSSQTVAQPLQDIGRWTIQYEPSIISKKVNWANEDHCGVCKSDVDPVTILVEDDILVMLGCCYEIPSGNM